LTLNATSLNIIKAVDAGDLVDQKPLRERSQQVRWLYVTPYINGLLDGRERGAGFPDSLADTLVAVYAAGFYISMSLSGATKVEADFKRIQGADEVWAMCFRRPRPGWRLLGRFMFRDQFIALRAYHRNDLAHGRYTQRSVEVIEDWASMFGADVMPLRGGSVNDYLSGTVHDADQAAQRRR